MTAPRRRTVASIAEPYSNHLVPMPRRGDGVCVICRRGVQEAYATCFKCGMESLGVGRGGADVAAAIALAPAEGQHGQLARELFEYKRGHRSLATGLAAVLWHWLARHEPCVAREAGVDGFPIITTVPSSSGRAGNHPLVHLVSGVVIGSAERYRSLLDPSGKAFGQREFSVERYAATVELDREPVLVIDDTWTTGAHAHSAARALKDAGAGPVAVLAIGRWYHPNEPVNKFVEEQRRGRQWSWDECMFDE